MSGQPAANDPIPLPLAARLAGVPARTLRNWIGGGKLAAIRGHRGWLVRLRDIEHIAATISNHAATAAMAGDLAAGSAAHMATSLPDAATVAANAATDQQLQAEALVQQLLAPFVAEQTRLAEELGRVKAERDARDETISELRRRAEIAEAEVARQQEVAAARRAKARAAQTRWARLRAFLRGDD